MIQIMLLITIALTITSSSSFWTLWVGLELYSFTLMPWLMDKEGKLSKMSMFFYFLTQFLASVTFLACSMTTVNKTSLLILFCSLLMKISCFPFHGWFVDVVPLMPWDKISVLVTLSKLVPLTLLMIYDIPRGFFWLLILGLLSPASGYGTLCVRTIIAYSSVAHSSWLVVCTGLSKGVTTTYITVYIVMMALLCSMFHMESLSNIKHGLLSKGNRVHFIFMILALSGLPPFLGFLPKFLVLEYLVQTGSMVEPCMLGVLSVLPVYLYLKTGMSGLGLKSCLGFLFCNPSYSVFTVLMIGINVFLLALLT